MIFELTVFYVGVERGENMLKHKLKVGVDVDDVLYECVSYVCHQFQ